MDTGNLFRELSRRRVFRVLAAYAIVAWLLVQVSEVAFNAFALPPWALQLVIALALVGLPVVGVLAWAFDVTDRGIERTASMGATGDSGAAESTRSRPGPGGGMDPTLSARRAGSLPRGVRKLRLTRIRAPIARTLRSRLEDSAEV